MNTTATNSTNWRQIYSLMALNAAIVISWIAYHNYQPKVLEIFHFQELSFFLVAAQALILVFIPPLAGVIADRVIQSSGNRFVVFTVGISVTAMVFMCVAFTVGTATTINLTSALPFMIVVWLISMNIFHSPANSMLELFAPAKQLPTAMAMMVITTELLYAFEPLIVGFVDAIGPVSTFALGGVLLIITGYFFKVSTRSLSLVREHGEAKNTNTDFALVLLAGLVLGLATALFKNYLPQKIDVAFQAMRQDGINIVISGSMVISFGLVVAALAAWPFSKLVDKVGTQKSLIYGLTGAFIIMLPSFLLSNVYALMAITLFAAPFISYATVAGFPYALGKLSAKNVTLGAGIFFGSVELADGVMNLLQQ